MRCPNCNRFASCGPVADDVSVEVDGDTIRLSGTLKLACGRCGGELASAEMEADEPLEGYFTHAPDQVAGETAEYGLDGDPDVVPLKYKARPGRYYGVEAVCDVRQTIRDKDGNLVGEDTAEVQLSCAQRAGTFEGTT